MTRRGAGEGSIRERKDGTFGRWTLSPRSVEQAHAVLRCALQQAVKDGILPSSPVAAVTPPHPERHEPDPRTPEEIEQLFAVTREERLHRKTEEMISENRREDGQDGQGGRQRTSADTSPSEVREGLLNRRSWVRVPPGAPEIWLSVHHGLAGPEDTVEASRER